MHHHLAAPLPMQVLGLYAERTGAAFLPHYEEALDVLSRMSRYFHEEVRLQAYEALLRMVTAAGKLFPADAAGNPSPQVRGGAVGPGCSLPPAVALGLATFVVASLARLRLAVLASSHMQPAALRANPLPTPNLPVCSKCSTCR